MSYIGRGLQSGAFRQLDDISSGFDGSDTTHTMQVNSTNVTVGDVNQILLSLGGVIQKPGTDFTVSGSVLTFTTAPAANTSFFAILLGSDNGGTVTPTDGSVTASKLATTVLTGQTDIGAAIVDADLFLVDDGAGGTLRKVTASRLKTYAGGTDLDGAVTINESSADVDFRVESNGNTHMLFVDGGNNRVGIGTTPDLGILHIRTADSSAATHTSADELVLENSGHCGISILSGTSSTGNIYFNDSGGVVGYFEYNHDGNNLSIGTAGSTRSVLTGAGHLFHGAAIASEQEDPLDSHTNTDNIGILLKDGSGGSLQAAFDGPAAYFNRVVNDGDVVVIRQDGTSHGSISVSGATTSYNAFTGSHWSRLADNSKPTILRGTVMESLDTMMEWYQVDYEYDTADGKTRKHKKPIALPDGKSVGDNHTITDNKGIERTGKIIKEDDVKHVYSKISTTADSTRVYGLFHCWDNDDDTVNDMEIAQVGTYIIRVHKDITVSAGDLLVSNGDGTAKKQDDDIIRSKTIAKVNSNVKVETYDDGSYTVPCTLHC